MTASGIQQAKFVIADGCSIYYRAQQDNAMDNELLRVHGNWLKHHHFRISRVFVVYLVLPLLLILNSYIRIGANISRVRKEKAVKID